VKLLIGLLQPPNAQTCISQGLVKGATGSAAHNLKKPKAPGAKLLKGLTPAFGAAAKTPKRAAAKTRSHRKAKVAGRLKGGAR
jgi:hypothetical protein